MAILVFFVSEDDGLSRTGLLASRHDVTVSKFSCRLLRLNACLVNALNAVRALLHNSTASDRDIGIVEHSEKRNSWFVIYANVKLSLVIRVVEVVEASHLVGAVVRAVASTHAAVVNHLVESFVTVNRRSYWANGLARSLFAMHAPNWLPGNLRIL